MPIDNAHYTSCQEATTNSVKQHRLRKRMAYLSEREASGKELVSLYVPSKMALEGVVGNLKKEVDAAMPRYGDAKTREHLDVALKTLIHQLRQLKINPQNGLALFVGSPLNGGLSVEEIAPPQPITCYSYTVDSCFNLEPLRRMLRDPKVVGILTLDAKQATFGLVKGDRIDVIESITSGVSGKTGKGGQSQRRYERERDMALTAFFHRVAEHAVKAFLENKVNVLLAGGPGLTKHDFLKGDYLHYELANMLLNIVDTQSADEAALREVLVKSQELLQSMCGPQERRVVRRLMAELAKDEGLAIYGFDVVVDALRKGEVGLVIVTDDPKVSLDRDVVDFLEDLASQKDAAVEVVSTASPEKDSLTALGGVAALLRYKQK